MCESKEPVANTRKAYILRKGGPNFSGLYYEPIPFLELKKGDTFLLTEKDGAPVPNRGGSVACVAVGDAEESAEGVWGIKAEQITSVPSPLKLEEEHA
jgi:hypothetical protein